MSDIIESNMFCKNCNSENIDNYCSNCGQKTYKHRFTLKGFFHVIFDALNIERGFLHTFKMLFVNPGKVVNDYLSGKTKSYYNPLNYMLIIAGIYAFLFIWLKILDNSVELSNEIINNDAIKNDQEAIQLQKKFMEYFKQFVNFVPLLMLPFTSLVSKWYYQSKKLFYGEHLIMNSFLFAQSFIIIILLMPGVAIYPPLVNVFPVITFVSTIVYLCYALYKTFKGSRFKAIAGAIIIYIVGLLFFMLFLGIISFIVAITIALLKINS